MAVIFPLATVTVGSVSQLHGGNVAAAWGAGHTADVPSGTLLTANVPSAMVVTSVLKKGGFTSTLAGRKRMATGVLATGLPSMVWTAPVIPPVTPPLTALVWPMAPQAIK